MIMNWTTEKDIITFRKPFYPYHKKKNSIDLVLASLHSNLMEKFKVMFFFYLPIKFTDEELECSAEEVKVKLEELENEKVTKT